MRNFWQGAGTALLCAAMALAALTLLPVFGQKSVVGIQAKNLSNARQLALAAKLYAEDHEGRFPMHLGELAPEYLSVSDLANLQFEVREKSEDPVYAKQDWLYFGAFFDESAPPPIVIASPQTTGFKGKPPKRIVIAGDLTGSIMYEEQYQIELKKTIEAMHQRAGTPTIPATEPSSASPAGAAAPANPGTPAVPDEKPNIR